MSAPDRLPDEALDGLLDGSPSEEAVGTPLAAYLAELREDARATTPTPSADLAVVLDEGLEPATLADAGTTGASDEVSRGILAWRLRGRTLARVLITKLAALGILGKAAVAGAAVTVAASGAGAAGVLPEPAQGVFNDAIGREVQEAPADPDEQSETAGSDAEADTPPQTPADTATTPPLESDVSEDATGSQEGDEPGVDGGDVAEDASSGASEAPDGSDTEPPSRADRGDQAVEEAPTDATRQEVPPTSPPAAEGTEAGAAAGQGGDEQSPPPASEPPASGEPRN